MTTTKRQPLLFPIGQQAEMRSFIRGFRGAWFRCELKDVTCCKGQIKYQVQYHDYDDGLEWVKLYEVARRKGTHKRELMLRPQFPSIYLESKLPDTNAMPDVAVVVDGGWSVGDMVDWMKDGCFWSGTITKFMGDDTVMVQLPSVPVGEGLRYIVSCKELRPSLIWRPDSGWAFPTQKKGQNGHSHARLIQPANKALLLSKSWVDVVIKEEMFTAKTTPRSSLEINDSISSHTSTSSLPLLSRLMRSKGSLKQRKDISGKDKEQIHGESIQLDARGGSIRKSSYSDSVSSSYVGEEVPVGSSIDKMDPENVSVKKKKLNESIPLNSASCDSIESAIFDLEELVCRVKWLKQILKPGSPSTSLDKIWEFVEHSADIERK